MTTIACDGMSIAGDGRSTTDNGTICENTDVKVARLQDDSIIGCAGIAHSLSAVRDFVENDGPEPKDARALRLYPDGRCEFLSGPYWLPASLPAAIGSGIDLALGAMEAGATAEEAVRIACRRDASSGGQITVFHLG